MDTKAEANYRTGNDKKRCELCSMFEPPKSCSAVSGRITEYGLCDYFEPKTLAHG